MNDSFKEMFSAVTAEEELKNSTLDFISEKTRNYTVQKRRKSNYIYAAAACAVCTVMLFFGGYSIYFSPKAEISVDINPSIELSVNRFDRVISVKEFNNDGELLARDIDVKHKKYTQAIDEIVKNEKIEALMTQEEILTLTVVSSDEEKTENMIASLEKCTAGEKNAYCYSATADEAREAHRLGLSFGKYRAFLKLQKLNPDITADDVKDMTMREIRDLTDSYESDGDKGGSQSSQNTSGKGNDSGNGKHKSENQIHQGQKKQKGRRQSSEN